MEATILLSEKDSVCECPYPHPHVWREKVPSQIISFITSFPDLQFLHILWVTLLIIAHLHLCAWLSYWFWNLLCELWAIARINIYIYKHEKKTWCTKDEEKCYYLQVCRPDSQMKIWIITLNVNYKTVWDHILKQCEF